MPSKTNLEDLFKKWNELNKKVEGSFGTLDFGTIRKIRDKQREVEDKIYAVLVESAPPEIKSLLTEDCNDMEIGYEEAGNKFYFLMEDPDQFAEGPMRVLAITIDLNKNIEAIKDFKRDD